MGLDQFYENIDEFSDEELHEVIETIEDEIKDRKVKFNEELLSIPVGRMDEAQSMAWEKHTQNNCNCDEDADTFTLTSEGAGDIEMCLNCYGARGCVY